jgi:uncharacterized LabA/DUF88 family protein
MPSASFFIDGFNVYFSVKQALRDGVITHGKWLDYRALCQNYLGFVGRDTTLAVIHYYSAIATYRPSSMQRHREFIEVLKDYGIDVVLGNFKKKEILCRAVCGLKFTSYEEKETDLNIGLGILKAFLTNECDTAVIVSGDTDLLAAVRHAKELFPAMRIITAFPYRRHNDHFKAHVDSTEKNELVSLLMNFVKFVLFWLFLRTMPAGIRLSVLY